MILQLNPPIPLLTPKGKALAHFLIDPGVESNLLWVCFQDDTGECWTCPNPQVRAQKNITQGRESISEIKQKSSEPTPAPTPAIENDPDLDGNIFKFFTKNGKSYRTCRECHRCELINNGKWVFIPTDQFYLVLNCFLTESCSLCNRPVGIKNIGDKK